MDSKNMFRHTIEYPNKENYLIEILLQKMLMMIFIEI